MTKPVFISYARRVSAAHAAALHAALGGEEGLAFLDSSDIETGQQFPRALGEALFASHVIVVFAEEAYFTRWYCLRELQLALSPYLQLLKREPTDGTALASALQHVVVAVPSTGAKPAAMSHLPPLFQTTNWTPADQTEKLAAQVRARLALSPEPIGKRLVKGGEQGVLASLLQEAALPPPKNLAGVRVFPPELPQSLGERFIGRADDLWRLHFTLATMRGEAASAAALTGALHAAGGFGKTRLATEYLWRFGPVHYPGGLFWVDADVSEDRLTERFYGILQTLRPDTPALGEFLKAGRAARDELAQALQALPADKPVLVVVDNVPEPMPGRPPKPLQHWCPALGRVTTLATSRLRLAGDASVRSLPVDVLAPEAAVSLLTRDLDRNALAEADWRRLAEWVGYLPLALELLNGALSLGGLTPGELLVHLGGAGMSSTPRSRRSGTRCPPARCGASPRR
jgi:hypothetical protein